MSVPTLATSLEWLARSFADAATTGKPLTIDRQIAATFGIILDMAITRLEELDQLVASDQSTRRALRVAEADVARLEQQLRLLQPVAGAAPGGRTPPPSALPSLTHSPESIAATVRCWKRDRGAEETPPADPVAAEVGTLLDLSEVFRRERAAAGRPVPPEGGAA